MWAPVQGLYAGDLHRGPGRRRAPGRDDAVVVTQPNVVERLTELRHEFVAVHQCQHGVTAGVEPVSDGAGYSRFPGAGRQLHDHGPMRPKRGPETLAEVVLIVAELHNYIRPMSCRRYISQLPARCTLWVRRTGPLSDR